jgi:dihydroflavonol-4-reductase
LKILVTGSTGFIGNALCHELAACGEQVIAFHRPTSNTSPLDDLNIEHRIGDLKDPASINKAVKGIHALIHCAAQLGKPTEWQQYYDVSVRGTRTLLNAARAANVRRFIHTSSVAALGVPERGVDGVSPTFLTETHTWNFSPRRWVYGYAKYLAELEVQRAVALGLDAVIVNPSTVFGPGDVLRAKSSIIRMVSEQGLRLSAPGGMNVVHIRDVIRGHLSALEYGLRGERYILGGENITHDLFIQTIQNVACISSKIISLPLPFVNLVRRLFFLTSRILHLDINPGILNLAGFYFYYNLEKSQKYLRLPAPLNARQAITDACHWFKEYSPEC